MHLSSTRCCDATAFLTGLSFANFFTSFLEEKLAQQISTNDNARAVENTEGSTHEVLPDVAHQRRAIVNVALIGAPNSRDWVLIDAGPMGATKIRFGDVPPRAVVMTHGHFDHFGSLENLLQHWKEQGSEVPVYVHEWEAPYFRGEASYPPPDAGDSIPTRLISSTRRALRRLNADSLTNFHVREAVLSVCVAFYR